MAVHCKNSENNNLHSIKKHLSKVHFVVHNTCYQWLIEQTDILSLLITGIHVLPFQNVLRLYVK